MHCGKCGKEYQLGEDFCANCGAIRPRIAEKYHQTEANFVRLKEIYQSGKLDEIGFKAALQALVFQDAKGVYWMIGADSERWFSFVGEAWVPAEPPLEQSAAPSPVGQAQQVAQPEPAAPSQPPSQRQTPPDQPTDVQPIPRHGIPRGCWWAGGLLILLVGCGVFALVMWQPTLNLLVPYAVAHGWAKVIEEVPLPSEIQPTLQPTPPPVVENEPGWSRYACSAAGVTLAAPENFTHIPVSEEYFILKDEAQKMMIDAECLRAEHGGTFQQELAWWMAFQKDPTWEEPRYEQTGVGQLGWTQGINSHGDPIFTVAIGPTKNGRMIYFWAQAPSEDWDASVETFLRIARSVAYQK